jgi:periplasmic divalent cation tolerance protein
MKTAPRQAAKLSLRGVDKAVDDPAACGLKHHLARPAPQCPIFGHSPARRGSLNRSITMQQASHTPESNKLYCVVLTTTATTEEAESLARGIVETRLGACVQIQAIRSIYRWQGELCDESEFRLSVKTRQAQFAALEHFIREHHSYDTPEIVQIPITAGFAAYLQWIDEGTQGAPDEPEPEAQFALP